MLKITKKFLWNLTDDDDEKRVSIGGGGPSTIFSASPALTQTDPGNISTTLRMKLPVTGSGLTQIRVTIKPGLTGGDLTILGLAFGKWDPASNINTLAPMIEGKFGGVSGFTAKTTPQTCDWTNIPGLDLSSGDSIVVGLTTGGSGHCVLAFDNAQPAGIHSWWQTVTAWNTQNVDSLGFNDLPNYNFAVVSVETQ